MSIRSVVASLTIPFILAAGNPAIEKPITDNKIGYTAGAEEQSPGRGPFIHYKYPTSGFNVWGGVTEKDIDCGKLFRFASEPKTLYASCDFLEHVDNNGQEICNVTDVMPATEEAQKAAFGTALLYGLRHYASPTGHNTCRAQAGIKELELKKTPAQVAQLYGADWQTATTCPLIEIRNACRAALGITR